MSCRPVSPSMCVVTVGSGEREMACLAVLPSVPLSDNELLSKLASQFKTFVEYHDGNQADHNMDAYAPSVMLSNQ